MNAGSTLRFNRDQDATLDITNNGTIRTSHNLTLKSADTGTGTYQVEGGTLDLAGQAVSGKISLSAGALSNTAGAFPSPASPGTSTWADWTAAS